MGKLRNNYSFFVVIGWRRNYRKVRRIKAGSSIYGDNKDMCGGKWKIKDSLDQGGE